MNKNKLLKMQEYTVNQFGDKSIFIDKHNGDIYLSDSYLVPTDMAFEEGSYELLSYEPSINPPIPRPEVDVIFNWIARDADSIEPQRVGILYGKAGIGKSVVMHDLLKKIQEVEDWKVLGLKSDIVEFADTDDLSKKLHLSSRIEDVIFDLSKVNKRVVLLVDQIDALSLSLSSNRTPLRSLLKLIQRIQCIQRVRVVVSCRPYDLEYDPTLEQLRVKNKWELKEFNPDVVKKVLELSRYDKPIGIETIHFLGNPLNLHLFLKVFKTAQLRYPLSQEDLYGQLWCKYIIDDTNEEVNKTRVVELLDAIANRMYERQELTIRRKIVETEYSKELNYLLHSEILTMTPNGLLQFFHQTMFDYVYARRFIEQGKDILEQLSKSHQGLFIRSAVRSILSFLRDSDPLVYINALIHLLFDKTHDGYNVYRFHIRSLILSSMVFYEKPIKEELILIETKLLNDDSVLYVLLDAVNNASWFKNILSVLWKHYTWRDLPESLKDRLVTIGRRIVWQNTDVVLDFANLILEQETDGDKQRISNMLYGFDVAGSEKKLIGVYERITISRCPIENTSILRSLCKNEPDFVMQVLRDNIMIQLQNQVKEYLTDIKLSHYEESVYKELESFHPEIVIDFYIELLELILKKESFLIDSHDLFYSIEFSHFKRCKDADYFTHDFVESLINKVLDKLESDIISKKDSHELLLENLSQSSFDGIVFISLYCYALAPQYYIDSIYNLFLTRNILVNAPSWVEYQAGKLLSLSFTYFGHEQKNGMIDFIMHIKDKDEWTVYHKRTLIERLQWNIPLFWIDNRKGTLLNLLDKDILRLEYKEAYKELLRIKRKFPHKEQLQNSEPFRTSSRIGDPSMERDKALKMNDYAWKISMRSYNTDTSLDWNRPSQSGQQHLLQEITKADPIGKFQLLMDVVNDETINLSYPIAGLKGLIESGRIDLATTLFNRIVFEIGDDINRKFRNYDLHSFLFALDGFLKSTQMPKSVFDFICKAAIEAKEDLNFRGETSSDIYNFGVNQSRGNAGYKLVECCKYHEWSEIIFNTIETIALSASEYTRAAILLNFAVLNTLDKDRSLRIFLQLMHDYHPALMSMPVHNYNPLVYYVNYAFDELVPFFEKALEIEECYEQQVIILWLAWNHTHKPKAKEFINSMIEISEKSRLALTHFLTRLDGKITSDMVDYLCGFMQDKYLSDKMAGACDDIFNNLEDVSPDLQFSLADTFVNSNLCTLKNRSFYNFLASYALIDPIQTLKWLETLLTKDLSVEDRDYNIITDIIIQSYNGIKSFCDNENMLLLERAMDMLDDLMQRQDNRYAITNFIYKLDNE